MTRNTPAWIGIAILVTAGVYLVATHDMFEAHKVAPDDLASLASGVALLIVIGGSAVFGYQGRATLALKQALAWMAIGLGLLVFYTYRVEFERVAVRTLGELLPGTPVAGSRFEANARQSGSDRQSGTDRQSGSDNVVAITAGRGGHFAVEALVNETSVRLMADTGATLVALTYEDARRVGLDPDNLSFDLRVHTANGVARNARAILAEISIGSITLTNVQATVARQGQLQTSLLGMSFLSRLKSFQISGAQMLLHD
ncbi:MAG: retropepsin-like aspartic protease family protein [Alphaproteobacteria bacterium]